MRALLVLLALAVAVLAASPSACKQYTARCDCVVASAGACGWCSREQRCLPGSAAGPADESVSCPNWDSGSDSCCMASEDLAAAQFDDSLLCLRCLSRPDCGICGATCLPGSARAPAGGSCAAVLRNASSKAADSSVLRAASWQWCAANGTVLRAGQPRTACAANLRSCELSSEYPYILLGLFSFLVATSCSSRASCLPAGLRALLRRLPTADSYLQWARKGSAFHEAAVVIYIVLLLDGLTGFSSLIAVAGLLVTAASLLAVFRPGCKPLPVDVAGRVTVGLTTLSILSLYPSSSDLDCSFIAAHSLWPLPIVLAPLLIVVISYDIRRLWSQPQLLQPDVPRPRLLLASYLLGLCLQLGFVALLSARLYSVGLLAAPLRALETECRAPAAPLLAAPFAGFRPLLMPTLVAVINAYCCNECVRFFQREITDAWTDTVHMVAGRRVREVRIESSVMDGSRQQLMRSLLAGDDDDSALLFDVMHRGESSNSLQPLTRMEYVSVDAPDCSAASGDAAAFAGRRKRRSSSDSSMDDDDDHDDDYKYADVGFDGAAAGGSGGGSCGPPLPPTKDVQGDTFHETVLLQGFSSSSEGLAEVSPALVLTTVAAVFSQPLLGGGDDDSGSNVAPLVFLAVASLRVLMQQFALASPAGSKVAMRDDEDLYLLSRFRRNLKRVSSWHGRMAFTCLSSVVNAVLLAIALASGAFHGLPRQLELLADATIAAQLLTAAIAAVSFIGRRWPRLKCLPSDDNFRATSFLKAAAMALKCLMLSTLRAQPQRSPLSLLLLLLVIISTCVLTLLTLANLRSAWRSRQQLAGVQQPGLFLFAYAAGLLWEKATTIALIMGADAGAAAAGDEFAQRFALLHISLTILALLLVVYSNNAIARYLDGQLRPRKNSGGLRIVGRSRSVHGILALNPLVMLTCLSTAVAGLALYLVLRLATPTQLLASLTTDDPAAQLQRWFVVRTILMAAIILRSLLLQLGLTRLRCGCGRRRRSASLTLSSSGLAALGAAGGGAAGSASASSSSSSVDGMSSASSIASAGDAVDAAVMPSRPLSSRR